MPFDGAEEKVAARTRGYQLVEALKNLPENFTWDYGEIYNENHPTCGTLGCALGLAHVMWPRKINLPLTDQGRYTGEPPNWKHYGDVLGISAGKAMGIFGSADYYGHFLYDWSKITAPMVSDALKAELDKGAK